MTEQLTEDYPAAAHPGNYPEPTRVSWATVPKVNLLPLEIVQKRRFRRTQQMLGGLVVAGLLFSAGGVFLAQRGVSSAQAELMTAQNTVTSLQSQTAKYSAVPEVIAEVDAAKTARTTVMSNDVLWYQFMNDVQGALPAGVTGDAITVLLTPSSGAAISANPLTPDGIGTLNITGSAEQYQQVSAWLDALSKITGVSAPSLTSASKSGDGSATRVAYTISAVMTDAALSHRYDDKKGS